MKVVENEMTPEHEHNFRDNVVLLGVDVQAGDCVQ